MTNAEAQKEVSLADQVEAAIRGGTIELPVLPEVAIRVRELAAQDGPLSAVARVVEREPAFAAAVLRYANSVAFAGIKKVVDLQEAVRRLGMAAVEQTVLAISAQAAFQSPDPQDQQLFRALWDHAVTTAMAARRLNTRGVLPERAFLAGLLHDAGKVVILRCVAQLRVQQGAQCPYSGAVLQEFFDALHCSVGDLLFESWNIPPEIRNVARRHHDSRFTAPDDLLIATVAFADQVAAKLGASLQPNPDLSLLDLPAAALLRVDDVKVASLLIDVEEDVLRFQQGA